MTPGATMDPVVKVAPAQFLGVQPGCGVFADIELWNLTEPIGEHPAGSTLSRQTIERHGYTLPSAQPVAA